LNTDLYSPQTYITVILYC